MQASNTLINALLVSAALSCATAAEAQNILQMDLNSLSVQKVGGWDGLTHTGTLIVSADIDSTLNAILVDGSNQAGFIPGQLLDVQGTVELLNGVVVGGMLHVDLITGATYDAALPSGQGNVNTSAGSTGPFLIDGLTISGFFNNLVGGAIYAGVDVSLWDGIEPLNGSYLLFKLGPIGDNGDDDDVDIDLFLSGESDTMFCCEFEPNDSCETKNRFTTECELLQGRLEERLVPGPQPDTWLCVFDKFGEIIASNDNGGTTGNSKASGLWSEDGDGDGWADILRDNGDGTYSLRLAVTGFPDGFDGNCDGFFQNGPHGQQGEFTLYVTYEDGKGVEIRTDTYVDEFITGAEAFRINFTAPAGAATVHIDIDNMTGRETVCSDVDFISYTNLEPLVAYCITVIGGLDADCLPTDTVLGWFNKNCELIFPDDDGGPAAGYSELCVVADINGVITFGVTGKGDLDFDGYDDVTGEPHGLCGDYLLNIRRADGEPLIPTGPCDNPVTEAVQNGDLNEDGVINAFDLVQMLANWGLTSSQL